MAYDLHVPPVVRSRTARKPDRGPTLAGSCRPVSVPPNHSAGVCRTDRTVLLFIRSTSHLWHLLGKDIVRLVARFGPREQHCSSPSSD